MFTGSAGLLPVLGLTGGLQHPAPALAAYCTLTAIVSVHAHLHAAPFIAAVCWLFYDGFVIHQQGELAWDGLADVNRMGLLISASLLGTVTARLNRALRYRRA
ncbi:hypothetical protein J7E91_12940 [Streptomyces sp. ISL-99]|uniref:hypothetical protein n=1 Tax=Streptomyces sp. ISL-99 TaxID=2819193 RepID=UPI001BEBA205|nr:hypothetical protein [Streptomyces sp. ISL-99]MBT2526321.1 hypothetical protein [Streptomyces sp. ISL-99]